MSAKIEKIKDNIVITIPFWSKRINPYMPDEDVGSYPTLAGMIYTEKGEEKIGFVYVIDMDYKGKPDQYGEIMYHYLGEEDNFRKVYGTSASEDVKDLCRLANKILTSPKEREPDYYDRIFSGSSNMNRYNEIYKQVGKWVGDKEILDIGCGTAELQKYVTNYSGFDFSPKAVEIANNPNVKVGNAYNKEDYRKLDTYIALEVLEHLDDISIVKNIPDGATFIFSVPSFPDPAHLRHYTEESMINRLGRYIKVQDIIRFNWDNGKWSINAKKSQNFILLVKSKKAGEK